MTCRARQWKSIGSILFGGLIPQSKPPIHHTYTKTYYMACERESLIAIFITSNNVGKRKLRFFSSRMCYICVAASCVCNSQFSQWACYDTNIISIRSLYKRNITFNLARERCPCPYERIVMILLLMVVFSTFLRSGCSSSCI